MPFISPHFDAIGAVVGGLLVGLSTATLFLAGGQVTGISGFVSTWAVKEGPRQSLSWRGLYILGLAIAGFLVNILGFGPQAFGPVYTKPWVVAAAGALVGFSTRLGNGCTSGHGLCGMARLSLRSTLASLTFTAAGMVVATLCRQVPALRSLLMTKAPLEASDFLPAAITKGLVDYPLYLPGLLTVGFLVMVLLSRSLMSWMRNIEKGQLLQTPVASLKPYAAALALGSGLVFGLGLAVSQMASPTVGIKAFLDPFNPKEGWNPALAVVLGVGAAINLLAFSLVSKSNRLPLIPLEQPQKPLKDCVAFGNVPANTKLDKNLLVGSALFGVGWGLAGVCPGPSVVNFGAGSPVGLIFFPCMVVGMWLLHYLQEGGVISTVACPVAAPPGKEEGPRPSLRGGIQQVGEEASSSSKGEGIVERRRTASTASSVSLAPHSDGEDG
jgi:uncharacterized protein